MAITKIVIGTVAATGLAGAGIAGLSGASSPKPQADPLALTRTPAVVTAPIYAPIAALPGWVERWKAVRRSGSGPKLRPNIARNRGRTRVRPTAWC